MAYMDRPSSTSRLAPALTVAGALLVFCLPLAIYVAGYFYCGDFQQTTPTLTERFMSAKWQCAIYVPAAKLEAAWTGTQVDLWYHEGFDLFVEMPGNDGITRHPMYRRFGE
jgi:hypothetical protein